MPQYAPPGAALRSLALAAALLAAGAACTDRDPPTAPAAAVRPSLVDDYGNHRLAVDIEDRPDAPVWTASVLVSGPDLERPLEFTLERDAERGVVAGAIAVPAGKGHVIHVRALDEGGRELYAGETVLALGGDKLVPQTSFTLEPRELEAGEGIPAFLGSYRVAMSPRETVWEEGRERVVFEGRVLDPDGRPIPLGADEVEWLTPDDLPGDFRPELDGDVARGFFWPVEPPVKMSRFELCYLARRYCRGTVLIPQKLFPTLGDYAQVDGGSAQTCVRKRSGLTRCFGLGAHASPADLAPFSFTTISAGGDGTAQAVSCGVTSGGKIRCWGGNKYGQLGVGAASAASSAAPVEALSAEHFTTVTVGGRHACALNAAGRAFCWGHNGWGQLGTGQGSPVQSDAPVAVAGGLTFISLSAGYEHTCGVTTTNDAFCWGYGDKRLGSTDTTDYCNGSALYPCAHAPRPVIGGQKFKSISAGTTVTCAVAVNDDGFCWGHYAVGRAGVGGSLGNTASLSPVLVDGGLHFAAMAAGGNHACGMTTQGEVWCWGRNLNGELGSGNMTWSDVPVKVVASSAYGSIGSGTAPCGVARYGTHVECWGWNGYEQFGTASPYRSSLPVALPSW